MDQLMGGLKSAPTDRKRAGGLKSAPACLALIAALVLGGNHALAQEPVRVRVQTELGDIVVEVDQARAPGTAANFLRYVDAGHYDGGVWHRTVKMDNQPESPVKIEVIQAGVNPDRAKEGFPPIALERTNKTGLLHKDGTISMARGAPDSATSGWFICINDQPSLDFGGARNPDGQGFAAFGRVVSGMDVVRKIQNAPSSSNRTTNTEAQRLTPPIKIIKVERLKR
jgi:peptidyl-prolyl cis-trans isomerase A (cyclophilin A)